VKRGDRDFLSHYLVARGNRKEGGEKEKGGGVSSVRGGGGGEKGDPAGSPRRPSAPGEIRQSVRGKEKEECRRGICLSEEEYTSTSFG